MKEIKLSNSTKITIVDDEDYDMLLNHSISWYMNGRGYVTARSSILKTGVFMHKVVLPNVLCVDHIDNNKLNNTRNNLRSVTPQQNITRRKKYYNASDATSKYIGISFDKKRFKFRIRVHINGHEKQIGSCENEMLAAVRRDRFVRNMHGEHASVNYFIS